MVSKDSSTAVVDYRCYWGFHMNNISSISQTLEIMHVDNRLQTLEEARKYLDSFYNSEAGYTKISLDSSETLINDFFFLFFLAVPLEQIKVP